MMRCLVADYARQFPAFRGSAGLQAVTYLPLESLETLGNFNDAYSEVVDSDDISLRMTWRQIGEPVAIEVTPEHSVTGAHDYAPCFYPRRADGDRDQRPTAERKRHPSPSLPKHPRSQPYNMSPSTSCVAEATHGAGTKTP